ncbi:MAG: hypothetical protein ACYC91_08315 [Solirubrobacteraceae bacterium]
MRGVAGIEVTGRRIGAVAELRAKVRGLGQLGIWPSRRRAGDVPRSGSHRPRLLGRTASLTWSVFGAALLWLVAAAPAVAAHYPPNAVPGQVSMTVTAEPGPVLQFSYTVTPTPCPGGGCGTDYGDPYLISIYVDNAAGDPAVGGDPTLVTPVPDCTAQGDPAIACNAPGRNIDDPNSALPISGTFKVKVKSVNAPATAEIDVAGFSINTYQTGIAVPPVSNDCESLIAAARKRAEDDVVRAEERSNDAVQKMKADIKAHGIKTNESFDERKALMGPLQTGADREIGQVYDAALRQLDQDEQDDLAAAAANGCDDAAIRAAYDAARVSLKDQRETDLRFVATIVIRFVDRTCGCGGPPTLSPSVTVPQNNSTIDATGTVGSASAHGSRATIARLVIVSQVTYINVPAGRVRFGMGLNARGKQLLRRQHHLRVRVRVLVIAPNGKRNVSYHTVNVGK